MDFLRPLQNSILFKEQVINFILFNNKQFYLLLVILSLILPVFASGKQENRNYLFDVEIEAGSKLTNEEKEIADVVFLFYNVYYGYENKNVTPDKAARNMNQEEYTNTVRQAAKVSKNSAAKGLRSTGKAGEKLLKALIIATEDAARKTGSWIDKKAKEYDDRNK